MARSLLAYGAHHDARDRNGCTPLFLCAQSNSQKVARVLLSHGADINARDNAGLTPLDAALASGHYGMAGWLKR